MLLFVVFNCPLKILFNIGKEKIFPTILPFKFNSFLISKTMLSAKEVPIPAVKPLKS